MAPATVRCWQNLGGLISFTNGYGLFSVCNLRERNNLLGQTAWRTTIVGSGLPDWPRRSYPAGHQAAGRPEWAHELNTKATACTPGKKRPKSVILRLTS